MHIFRADMLNHYMVITQHHLIHFYIVVWVSNVGWTTRSSQVLIAAPTLLELHAPVKHRYKLQTVIVTHMLHLRMHVH